MFTSHLYPPLPLLDHSCSWLLRHHPADNGQLFRFCGELDNLHVRYGMLVARDDAVMVTVVLPRQYLEIEFFADGSVEIERYVSQGVEECSDAQMPDLINVLRS